MRFDPLGPFVAEAPIVESEDYEAPLNSKLNKINLRVNVACLTFVKILKWHFEINVPLNCFLATSTSFGDLTSFLLL